MVSCRDSAMTTAADRVSSLRQLLLGPDDSAACEAARELRRFGGKAHEAVDDLISAATLPWTCGCPQRFPAAMEALLKIAPDDPRLVPIIRDTIRCSNYGIQKTCVLALIAIGTGPALETLYHIDRYWYASPKSLPFKKLMYKSLGEIEERGLNKLVTDAQSARARLVEWLEGRRKGPPCPKCGEPLRTEKAKQCLKCGADWHETISHEG